MTLLGQARRISHHSRDQAPDGLDHRHRSHLTAVQDIVAEADLPHRRPLAGILNDPLVDSLIAAASEHEVFLPGQFASDCLAEPLPRG